ncbi:MAG: hypothetical protein C0621_00250 [Desulfuromonas sp.]|nr:MAG: hypothetical protein C0621_00250 [Desulfuromonas sp.]
MLTAITIESRKQQEMIDISAEVQKAIRASGILEGSALLFVSHTTAAVTINENADPDVVRDMLMELGKVVPDDDGYKHLEGNSAAHLKSSLVGCAQSLIIHQGSALLGTWQGIYFCEFDGPRRRSVQLKLSAE